MVEVPQKVAEHLKGLKASVKHLDALIKALRKAGEAPLLQEAALRDFRSRWGKLSTPAPGKDAVDAWIDNLTGALAGPVRDAQATFGAALEDGLREAGLPARGRWPEWMSGPFRISARPERGEVALDWGPGAEPLAPSPLDPAAVGEQIQTLAADLKARHEPEAFAGRLLQAWRMGLAMEGRTEGDVPLGDLAPLVAVLAQGTRFRDRPSRTSWTVPYDRIQLSYDLARMRVLETDGMTLRLRVATRDQTRRKGPLWLPDDAAGNGTFFATARFERRRR